MKIANRICLTTAVTVGFIGLLSLTSQSAKPQKIKWQFDAVYYSTNNSVWDEERNKTNPQPSNIYFTKTVIYTNQAPKFYLGFGDRRVELGAREDGVIVWRETQ